MSAGRHVLESVLEQIGDELRQQLPIAGERRGNRRVECYVQPGGEHARRVQLDHVGRECGEIHVLTVRGDTARFGACDLQQRRQRALHAVELDAAPAR